MQITPLYDRLLVKRFNEEERTKGGLYVPDTAKEKPVQGEVVAAGNGRVADDGKVTPLSVKKGDKILFGKYSGTEVKFDGIEYLIVKEDEVLGIIQ
jgi:chaperonin GroES